MAGVLYTRRRSSKEKPILDPDKFKEMLEESEPALKGFFDQLVSGTNPQTKSHIFLQASIRILEKQRLLQQIYTQKPGIIDFQYLILILMSNSYH